jgi:hypothetical protein
LDGLARRIRVERGGQANHLRMDRPPPAPRRTRNVCVEHAQRRVGLLSCLMTGPCRGSGSPLRLGRREQPLCGVVACTPACTRRGTLSHTARQASVRPYLKRLAGPPSLPGSYHPPLDRRVRWSGFPDPESIHGDVTNFSDTLKLCGFTAPKQANSSFPQDEPYTHVHLGVPTQYEGHVPQPGQVWMTYVSIKKTTGTARH